MSFPQFECDGKKYGYFDLLYPNHPNKDWASITERRIELPIAYEWFKDTPSEKRLEVGNVMGHYYDLRHDVVDLYEKVPWAKIINEDILTWNPEKEYDKVLSVSTIEHTENPVLAVQRIIKMAKEALITFPIGYNADVILDSDIQAKMVYMKRLTEDNQWVQVGSVKNAKYSDPFPYANAVVIIKT